MLVINRRVLRALGFSAVACIAAVVTSVAGAQQPPPGVPSIHAKIPKRLIIHNEKAGFHPLEVIEHATWNGARLIGMDDRLGKVREGFIADLLIVNGNPLDNLRVLNPYGADVMLLNGKAVPNYTAIAADDRVQSAHGGGIVWTIKDGIPYHVPTLMLEVKEMVAKARGVSTTNSHATTLKNQR